MDLRAENKNISRISSIIVAIITAIVVVYVLASITPRVDRYLTIRSIEACGSITKFERDNTEESFKASYPLQDLYAKCLTASK